MTKQSLGKWMAIGMGLTAAVAMPLSASAHGWGHHWGHGWSHDRDFHGGYGRGGHWERGHWDGGRWIAGALITGAVVGLVDNALNPPVVYSRPRVVYGPPSTVVYEEGPPVVYERVPVTRRVVTTRTVVYEDAPPTRYIRDDDDGD